MYKYLLYLLIILFSLPASAQDLYTDFSVNDRYGVVNRNSLEETVKPTYPKRIVFAEKYLGFEKEGQVYFYEKSSGKVQQFVVAQERYHLYPKSGDLLHIVQKQRSALLNMDMKIVKTFAEQYNTFNYYWSNYLIALGKNGYDVFDIDKSYKPILLHINANDYFLADFVHNGKILNGCVVFYGKDVISLFDDKFKLLKTVHKNVQHIDMAVAALLPDYTAKMEPDALDPSLSDFDGWRVSSTESGYRIYESSKFRNLKLRINESFDVRNFWPDDVMIFNRKDKTSFSFKLDNSAKKALIPLKYQQLMGLQIIDKN